MSRPATLGGGRLLAIDGPAGSGKTTLARAVAGRLDEGGIRSVVLSLDDLYDGWGGLDSALGARVAAQVLEPLAEGRPGRWQQYDWAAGRFDVWHVVPPPDVLVVEGCGAGAEAQAPYTTLLVWVEAEADVALDRMVARDGGDVLDHIDAWRAAERRHFAANHTRDRADIRLTT